MLPGRSSRTPTTLELCLEATWNVYMMQVLKLIWFRLRSASSEVGRHNSAQGKGTVSSHTALNCSKLLWKYHNPAQSINILCLVSVGQSFDHQTMIHDMRSLALKTSCCHFDVPGPQRMPKSAAWWPGEKSQMLHEDHDLHDCLCNLLSICVWSDCPFQILEQQIHQLKHDISDISVSCNSHQFSKTNTSFIISHMFLVYKWISVLVLRWTNLLSHRAFFQEKLDFVLHLEKTQCEMSNGLGNQNVSTSPSAFRFFEGLEEHSENQRPSKHFTPLIMQDVSQRHNMLQ